MALAKILAASAVEPFVFSARLSKSLSILIFLSDHFLQISRCIVGPHVKKTIDSFAYGALALGFDDLRQAFLHLALKLESA